MVLKANLYNDTIVSPDPYGAMNSERLLTLF